MASKCIHKSIDDLQEQMGEFHQYFQPGDVIQSLRTIVRHAIRQGFPNCAQLQTPQRMTSTLLSTLDKPSDTIARSTLPADTEQIRTTDAHPMTTQSHDKQVRGRWVVKNWNQSPVPLRWTTLFTLQFAWDPVIKKLAVGGALNKVGNGLKCKQKPLMSWRQY